MAWPVVADRERPRRGDSRRPGLLAVHLAAPGRTRQSTTDPRRGKAALRRSGTGIAGSPDTSRAPRWPIRLEARGAARPWPPERRSLNHHAASLQSGTTFRRQ